MARCPGHEDGTASLSISRGDDGRTVMHCHAGCKNEDIVMRIGLTMEDLFEKSITAKETLPEDKWPVVATYVYEDEKGQPLFRSVKGVSPDSARKTFRQHKKGPGDSWAPNMNGARYVLYQLPSLLAAPEDQLVFVPEGEKCVDAMVKIGLLATTNVSGASHTWAGKEYAETLRGRHVVVLPDNDDAGEKHAAEVVNALEGVAASVKTLKLPGLGKKGDVFDWIEAGGTRQRLLALATQIRAVHGFIGSADRVEGERETRLEAGTRTLSFGVKFLDDALGGIATEDLILVGARSGIGKTELAKITALHNCEVGKRVHWFALEAGTLEIERRMKFQIIASLYYRERANRASIDFLEWSLGRLDAELGSYDAVASMELRRVVRNLKTFYRIGSFTGDDFVRQLDKIKDETDLVILDHLHYVDSDDDNENRGYKKTVQKIRDTALNFGKPVIVVAHVRKGDRRYEPLIPTIDDFHGSSDIPKMATKAIMIAPDFQATSTNRSLWPTFMQPVKCRPSSARTRYAATMVFNVRTGNYARDYTLGKITDGGKVFSPLPFADLPDWASGGSETIKKDDQDD